MSEHNANASAGNKPVSEKVKHHELARIHSHHAVLAAEHGSTPHTHALRAFFDTHTAGHPEGATHEMIEEARSTAHNVAEERHKKAHEKHGDKAPNKVANEHLEHAHRHAHEAGITSSKSSIPSPAYRW